MTKFLLYLGATILVWTKILSLLLPFGTLLYGLSRFNRLLKPYPGAQVGAK